MASSSDKKKLLVVKRKKFQRNVIEHLIKKCISILKGKLILRVFFLIQ